MAFHPLHRLGIIQSDALIRRVLLSLALISLSGGCTKQESGLRLVPELIYPDHVVDREPLLVRAELRNDAKHAVRLISMKPSCGCVSARIDKRLIGPGQSEVVNIKVNTDGLHGWQKVALETQWQEEGSASKSFERTVKIEFDVKTRASIEPLRADLGEMQYDSPPRKLDFFVRRGDAAWCPWDNISVTSKEFPASISKVGADLFKIDVNIDPSGLRCGRIKDDLIVQLDYEGKPAGGSYVIPISMWINPGVNVTPKNVFGGSLKLGDSKEGVLSFVSNTVEFQVKSIRVTDPRVLSITPSMGQGRALELHYSLNAHSLGNQNGYAVVEIIENGESRSIWIPYFCCVIP